MYSYDRKNDMLINLDKEDVKISNLTSVNNDGFIEDFSKWYYLAENNDYIILISDKLYGNFNKGVGDVTVIKKAFEANGIDFGKEGYMVNLDKDHLINYFDCDIKKLKCENNLNYVKKYKSIGTSLEINGIQVSLNSDGTFEIPSADTLIDSMPIIIKILKSSIK